MSRLPAVITNVDPDGRIMLNVKPNVWLGLLFFLLRLHAFNPSSLLLVELIAVDALNAVGLFVQVRAERRELEAGFLDEFE